MEGLKRKTKRRLIVPLAGGKGGTGKTLLVANLGLALARQNTSALIVDLDLGASNLHTLLGLKNVKDGIGHLLVTKGSKIEEVIHATPWTGLSYIPGDNQVLKSANPHYAQKKKIINGLKRIPFELVIGDLGAGTSLNLLDFFLTSPVGLVVYTAELPSLLNTYAFLRQTLFRAFAQVLKDNHYASQVLEEYRTSPSTGPKSWTVEKLLERMAREAPGQERRVQKVLTWWHPGLVLNQVRQEADLKALGNLISLVRKKLSVEPQVMGALPFDQAVLDSIRDRQPVYQSNPGCPYSVAVGELASRLPAWRPTTVQELVRQSKDWNLETQKHQKTDQKKMQKMLAEALPVADDLKRALAEARKGGQEALAQGLEAALTNHLNRLGVYGLKPIYSIGQDFDPNLHQAVATASRPGARKGEILDEISLGFTLEGKLFRPSQVVVAE